jgi:hypothetical protein
MTYGEGGSMREILINADFEVLVAQEFVGLHSEGGRSSIRGGQTAANQSLASLDITGYAKQRSQVLLTIESLGDGDPAMAANPDLPVVFVFNEAALRKLQLSSKRIYFYLETLRDLSDRRDLSVFIGDPYVYGSRNDVAVTYAPVPSFAKYKNLAEVHPYPWLVKPHQY